MLSTSHSSDSKGDDHSISILDLPVEILCLMLQNLAYENIINFSKTCKSIYILGNNPYIKTIVREKKLPFLKVLRLFPDKGWDWDHLSESGDISIHFIKDHLDFKWNWKIISKRVNFEFVEQYKNLPWDWLTLVNRRFVFSDDFKKEKSHWFWPERIYGKSYWVVTKVNCDFLNKHPLWPNDLNWGNLVDYGTPLIGFIEEYIDKPWDWGSLSSCNNLTSRFIEEHIDKPWHWGSLSRVINRDFLEKYPDKPWDWSVLSGSYSISSSDFVIQNPHFAWDWSVLSALNFRNKKREEREEREREEREINSYRPSRRRRDAFQ